jgi:GMP synthase-like glutamine amidotransferase
VRLLAICHDEYSLPARAGQCFADRGFELNVHVVVEDSGRPVSTKPFPEATDFGVVLAMGAPWSVYDHATIGTWIGRELMLLREAHTLGIPILGICFGAQALAAALGGRVAPAESLELGWTHIDSDVPDKIVTGPWFQWHGDTFTLPSSRGTSNAIELARNPAGPQAFVSQRSLGVQFHPEIDEATLRAWLDHGGAEEVRGHGVDSDRLLAETQEREAEAGRNLERLIAYFLEDVAPSQPEPDPR